MDARSRLLRQSALVFALGFGGAFLAGVVSGRAPATLPGDVFCRTGLQPAAAAAATDVLFAAGFELLEAAGDSHAMGRWNPHPRHDTCTRAFHDSFFVVGPDGLRYPTWHPPVAFDPARGVTCSFGHEHGRDPRQSQMWKTKQIQRAYFWDANGNGAMDPPEEALAGLPFGYVNQQADRWYAANALPTMRHEDHVGHKVEWANDETDPATHNMPGRRNGGVWVGRLGNGTVQADTGMRCFFLAKAHQGVSTADAFVHNLHEVLYFADCRHQADLAACANPDDLSTCADSHPQNSRVSIGTLQPFGRAGGFTSFMPMCRVERRSDPRDFVAVGQSPWSPWHPDGPGDREIITRQCVEIGFLVPQGEWSGNFYEAWPASLVLRRPDGSPVLQGVNLLFDVQDANRYFYPESLKAQRGYDLQRPELAGTNLGYSMDLCYDTSLLAQGRRQRGGACDIATGYGTIAGVGWDDPRSAFRGLNRGMYFQSAVIDNAGGPAVWYTDPYGNGARSTPFPGALRQVVGSRRIDYGALVAGQAIDPRVVSRVHDDGAGTVHAPN
jgi:hypothetical protein